MEAIERYSGIFQGDEIRVTRRFTDFPAGDAILPNDVQLFSDAQFRRDQSPAADSDEHCGAGSIRSDRPRSNGRRSGRCATSASNIFRPACCIFSTGAPARSTRIPTAARPATRSRKRSSRVFSSWWNGMPTPSGGTIGCSGRKWTSASSTIPTSAICRPSSPKTGRRLWVLDVTSDLGVPTYVAITHWMQNGQENIEFGSGAHFDPRIALLRALTELNQFLSIGLMGGGTGEKPSLDGTTPLRLQDHPFLTPSGSSAVQPGLGSEFGRLDTREQVTACVELAKQAGLDFLVLDQTRPDIEVPVVRVIVPGMRHFYRRFAPGRLYDVPVKLGWRDRPTAGKRAQSDPPPYLRVSPACALPESRESGGLGRQPFPPGSAVVSRSKRARTEKSPPAFDGYSVGLGTFSAGAARRAQDLRTGLPLASFASGRRDTTRRLISWSGDWPGTVSWSIASGARGTARIRSSSSRRLPIIGRKRRSSAIPMFSSCRGSRTCDGAATRWCWNRRAPARCSEFAIRRLRPPSPCSSTPQQIKQLRRQDGFPGVELLALLVDCQIVFKIDAVGDKGLRSAEGDDSLVLWDFHDLLFHARSTEGRHANPIGGVYPYAGVIPPPPAVRRPGPERKSICASSRPDIRRPSRRRPSSCANVIRRASSMTSARSRSPSWRAFSTAPRVSSRDGATSSTSAATTIR